MIVSIANNYPAGSILRVRDTKRVFAAREFEGAPPLGAQTHTFLVLDGQQRLTSLYQAFYGVGEHRYYLDIQKLIDGADFDEAIFNLRANTKWAKSLDDFANQTAKLLLPLSALKEGAGGFLRWMFKLTNLLPPEERSKLQDALYEVNKKWISAIDDYHFPVVTLSDKTEPAALCTIFETLNRTGVRLSVFELLTARFWPEKISLRGLWDTSRASHPRDVLKLTTDDIQFWWQKVVEGLAYGIEILRDDCSVMLPNWLPYQTMLPPLAAVLATVGIWKTAEVGAQREKIKRWFWCAVFSQAYENSPNSQSAKDFGELVNWLKGGAPPEVVAAFRFDPKALRDVTPRQRSIYRGVICLILGAGSGARDFHMQAVITGKLMREGGLDDHHIFPAAFLNRLGNVPARLRDCVLNRTLIDRTTNQMISDRAPSDYLTEIRNTAGFPFEAMLVSHTLPVGEGSPLQKDDFNSFIAWRQSELWKVMKLVTGATDAADLEATNGGGK